MSKLLYFESVPPKSAYFPGSLAHVPDEKAEEWIFDGYCINAEKVLDPEPFFNPATVAKLKSSELESFMDEKHKFILDQKDKLDQKGAQIKSLSAKIADVEKRKQREDVGTFKRVRIQKQIKELEEKLQPLELKISEISNEIQNSQIELWNAQARFIEEFISDFKKHKAFSGLDELLDQVDKKNTEIKEAFTAVTDRFHIGYLPSAPFLPSRIVDQIDESLKNRNDVLDQISKKITGPINNKITQAYSQTFENMLQEKEGE